jgi:hypothetical protein|eukprot:COSAG06_NODE_4246_length_4437_cov_1.747810_1_plen_55_part_00
MGAVEIGAGVLAGLVILSFLAVIALAVFDAEGRFVAWTKGLRVETAGQATRKRG